MKTNILSILSWAMIRGEGGAAAGAGDAGAGAGKADPGAGGSIATGGVKVEAKADPAAANDWRTSLPEDMRGLPAIKDYKDVASLVKSHVNLQQMIGHDKIVVPNDKSTPEQVAEFYNKLGRPVDPDKYKLPEVKFTNGAGVPDEAKKHFMGIFHKVGLTQKQAEQLYAEYGTFEGQLVSKRMEGIKASQDQAIEGLKKEYGDAYGQRVTAAQVAVKTFGSPELMKWLDETGLGNDANFIKFFSNIGLALLDDKAVGGGETKFMETPAQAQEKIAALKKDKDFLARLTNKQDPNHKAARELWDELHAKLSPKGQLQDG